MPYAYRKSAGRFGEDDGANEVNRPPSRPSTSLPAAKQVIDMTPLDLYHNKNDPILTQRNFNPATVCNDDVSSLGNDDTTIGEAQDTPLEEVTQNPEVWGEILGSPVVSPVSPTVDKRQSMGTPALGVQIDPGEGEPMSMLLPGPKSGPYPGREPPQILRDTTVVDEAPEVKPKKARPTKKKVKQSDRRSVDPQRRRRKKKTADGSLASGSDPSMSSPRTENEGGKKRLKKKVRPSGSGDPARKNEGRKVKVRSRDPRSCTPAEKDQRERRRSKSRSKSKYVHPQEILEFVQSPRDLEAKGNDSKEFSFNGSTEIFEDIPVAPIDRKSPSIGNKIMSEHFRDFNESQLEPRPFGRSFNPPSFAMTLNPEVTTVSPKNPRTVTDDEIDDDDDDCPNVSNIGKSLEHAISSKPKERSDKKTSRKKGPQLLQKIFGGGNGISGRASR